MSSVQLATGEPLPHNLQKQVAHICCDTHLNGVQSLSCVRLFATEWTAAHQASLSFTISRSLLKPMSIESVMPGNHLILCRPLLLPSIFPSIGVFSNQSFQGWIWANCFTKLVILILLNRWTVKVWSFSVYRWKRFKETKWPVSSESTSASWSHSHPITQ